MTFLLFPAFCCNFSMCLLLLFVVLFLVFVVWLNCLVTETIKCVCIYVFILRFSLSCKSWTIWKLTKKLREILSREILRNVKLRKKGPENIITSIKTGHAGYNNILTMEWRLLKSVGVKPLFPWLFARLQKMPTHVASFDSLSKVLAYCSHDSKII